MLDLAVVVWPSMASARTFGTNLSDFDVSPYVLIAAESLREPGMKSRMGLLPCLTHRYGNRPEASDEEVGKQKRILGDRWP
jgi:hypothetical protein